MSEVVFSKYEKKGAYHWTECFGPVHRLNAYTLARYAQILRALAAHELAPGARLLDVGCGDAALTGLIAMKHRTIVSGVDTTTASIDLARGEFARRGLAGDFRTIDGYAYPWPDGSFEAVVCSDVIEHVQHPEALLNEMWRVLAPSGVLVVTTPVRYTEEPLDRLHVQEWFPNAFRELCTRTLGVPVQLELSHPVALREFYASSSRVIGRAFRIAVNVFAKCGHNPFLWTCGLRAFSTQTAIAKKP